MIFVNFYELRKTEGLYNEQFQASIELLFADVAAGMKALSGTKKWPLGQTEHFKSKHSWLQLDMFLRIFFTR